MRDKRHYVILILGLSVAVCCAFQDGRAAEKEAVNTNGEFPVPRLSPEPAAVSGVDKVGLDLNGSWRFNPAPPEQFWQSAEEKGSGWADIDVPGEWAMQGFEVKPETAAAYRKVVRMPQDWQRMRIKLRCGAVYSKTQVWANGRLVGTHEGGFTPFELDVTDAIEFGQDNRIDLAVCNESTANILSNGSKYAHHCLGGIMRDIKLLALPAVNLASYHVDCTLDDEYKNANMRVWLRLANEIEKNADGLVIHLNLWNPQGEPVDIYPNTFPLPEIPAGETMPYTIELPVRRPMKWDTEHPHLYKLTCRLRQKGKELEAAQRRFGFREIEVKGNQVYVNGKPVQLRGVCRHEIDPKRGRSTPPGLGRKDAEIFREANVNYIRTSHYPPREDFLEACDELGIFVNDEAPFCFIGMKWGHPYWKENSPHKPEFKELIVRQTLEMVQRDRSHPSVLIWSLANESMWGPNFEASAKAVLQLDPSRPLTFNYLPWKEHFHKWDEPYCAIGADHYPGPKAPAKYADYTRPILFDEVCHINGYNRSEQWADPGIRDHWGEVFAAMWEKMYASKGVLGGAIWAGINDAFHLPSGAVTGYPHWGVIDEWRRPKPEYWHVKKTYSPIKIDQRRLAVPAAGQSLAIKVANRYDFTNLSESRIEWSLDEQTGVVKADVPPRESGTLSIPVDNKQLEGQTLTLKFYDPRGFLADVYHLPIGEKTVREPPSQGTLQSQELTVNESDKAIQITGDTFSWKVNRHTGQLTSGQVDGQEVLSGGPVLMLLPLTSHEGKTPGYTKGPLNHTCSEWKADEVNVEQKDESVLVLVKGAYKQAEGEYSLRFDQQGGLQVSYRFISKMDLNPRQTGMVFDCPRAIDTLSWKRDAQWTAYCEGHIGRGKGTTRPVRTGEWPEHKPHTAPPWPWELDESEYGMGINDFRATRVNVYFASLRGLDRSGVYVDSDGNQHVRCWVDGERIRVLVAGFCTGGNEYYLNKHGGHYDDDRRPLKPGSVVEDTMQLRLLGSGK